MIIIKKKRPCHLVDFAIPVDHGVNIKENKKRDKYLDCARKLKKLWVTVKSIVIGVLEMVPKNLERELKRVGNQRMTQDCQKYKIVKICQNTE